MKHKRHTIGAIGETKGELVTRIGDNIPCLDLTGVATTSKINIHVNNIIIKKMAIKGDTRWQIR